MNKTVVGALASLVIVFFAIGAGVATHWHFDGQIKDLARRVTDQKREIETLNATNDRTKKDLSDVKGELESVRIDRDKAKSDLESTKNDIATKTNQLEELNAAADRDEERIASLEKEIAEDNEKYQNLIKIADERDKKIKDFESKVAGLESEINNRNKKIEDLGLKVIDLESKNHEKDQIIEDKDKVIVEQSRKIAILEEKASQAPVTGELGSTEPAEPFNVSNVSVGRVPTPDGSVGLNPGLFVSAEIRNNSNQERWFRLIVDVVGKPAGFSLRKAESGYIKIPAGSSEVVQATFTAIDYPDGDYSCSLYVRAVDNLEAEGSTDSLKYCEALTFQLP